MIYIQRKWFSDHQINKYPNAFFIFGDNLMAKGIGGQAKVCRDKKNTIGIPTKLTPGTDKAAYITSEIYQNNPHIKGAVEYAFNHVLKAVEAGLDIIWPLDGVGTGLALLRENCPELLNDINREFENLKLLYGYKEIDYYEG
jgi:hypothetical protein